MEMLRSCIQKGDWLCLQNVHLAITWLPDLEKEIFASKPAPGFRLFLTSEPHDKFSVSLLENSLKGRNVFLGTSSQCDTEKYGKKEKVLHV